MKTKHSWICDCFDGLGYIYPEEIEYCNFCKKKIDISFHRDEDYIIMMEMFDRGLSLNEIANEFSTSQENILAIISYYKNKESVSQEQKDGLK